MAAMMIGNDRVHAGFLRVGDLVMRGNAVVDGDDQSDAVPLHCFDRVPVQSVSLTLPARQQKRRVCADRTERIKQDRRCAHAVGVVVAVHADPLVRFDRPPDARNRTVHVGKRERIGQRLRFGMQERFDRGVIDETAPRKHGGKRSRKAEPGTQITYDGVRSVRVCAQYISHAT